MIDKIQAFDQVVRTLKWNSDRGNNPGTLSWKLETDMLQEELDELKEAITKGDMVGAFDALLDLKFVLIGTLGKMSLSPEQIVDGYEAVITANESKSKEKNEKGKITKPSDFVGPESKLQAILEERE